LREKIATVLASSMERVQVLLPFNRGELVELFHRRGSVDSEEHSAEGTSIAGRIPQSLRGYYIPYARALRH
jgi:GTP-binding protein HflX